MNTNTDIPLLNSLPYGVVKELEDIVLNNPSGIEMLIIPDKMDEEVEEGRYLNFYHYFYEDKNALDNQLKFLVNLPSILEELAVKLVDDVEDTITTSSEMMNETCKEMKAVIIEDTLIPFPNGTFIQIKEGDSFDVLAFYETDEGKYAVLLGKYKVPFVLNTEVIDIKRNK